MAVARSKVALRGLASLPLNEPGSLSAASNGPISSRLNTQPGGWRLISTATRRQYSALPRNVPGAKPRGRLLLQIGDTLLDERALPMATQDVLIRKQCLEHGENLLR